MEPLFINVAIFAFCDFCLFCKTSFSNKRICISFENYVIDISIVIQCLEQVEKCSILIHIFYVFLSVGYVLRYHFFILVFWARIFLVQSNLGVMLAIFFPIFWTGCFMIFPCIVKMWSYSHILCGEWDRLRGMFFLDAGYTIFCLVARFRLLEYA